MPPFVRAMLADITQTSQLSVEEMFREPNFQDLLRRDKQTRIWKERNFRYLLRRPVFHKGVLAAVVLLQRHEDEPFSERDLRTFDELPVPEAVNIAIGLDNKGEMQFRLDLIRDLGKLANDADALRVELVERLRRNYSWEHVSLYRVDRDREKLRLVCQSALPGRELPQDYSQLLNAGLLGAVRKTKRPVIVGNVKNDPRHLKAVYGTHSEMCLPVPGSRLRWILNVESELIDAFAEEEQRSVELVLGVVGFLLDRVETIEMNSAIFDSVGDGVILTSLDGHIQRVNPALLRMLGRTEADLLGQNLTNLIVPPGKAKAPEGFGDKILMPRLHALRVDLKWKRERKAVLLSGAELPMEVGGRFYLVSDVSFAERLEQMEALKRVFSSIAAEMRIPLSLACSFLGEVSKEGANVREFTTKALAELRRADLPLERILRLATLENREELPITEVDVTEALKRIKSELPRSQAGDVQLHVPSGVRQAKAAYSELAFCM